MADLIYFMIAGLGVGALYGLMGTGIVVAYRGSGVINFAHGAITMYAVFQFTELRSTGTFVLPWVDILPGDVNVPIRLQLVNGPMSFTSAIVATIVMAGLLGMLMHVVFRPLRNASQLGKVIGSVGVLLYLQGVALLHFGGTGRQLEPTFPSEPWQNFLWLGRAFPQRNLWAALSALAIALLLWAFYRFARFGLATRAAAENEKGAVLLGFSPTVLAATNWVLASVVGAVGGLIVGPIVGTVDPARYTLFIVAALGAALIGGLNSVLLATIGGICLGMAETGTQYLSTQAWFPEVLGSGAKDALPLLVVAAVLFVRGHTLPIRGTIDQQRLPRAPQPVRVLPHAVIWPVLAAVIAWFFTGPWDFAFTSSLIAAVLMLSYVVLTGYVGQISLAQLALAGTAGFAVARLMSDGSSTGVSGPGLPMLFAMPLAMALAVAVGLIIGLPALRIRGVQLAVVTIAAAVFLEGAYFRNPSLTGVSLSDGLNVPRPELFGLDLGIRSSAGLSDSFAFSLFAIAVLTICAVAVTNIRRSSTGRRFLAVRANERAAAAAGIDVSRTKMLAFGISSALAGLAGCMFAFQSISISNANFAALTGLAFLAFVYLGGISSVNGAIVGGVIGAGGLISFFSRFHLPGFGTYFVILGGVGLVVTAIIHPEGIAPYFQPYMRALGTALVHWRAREWRAAGLRLGPFAAVGALAGWVFWARHDEYSVWMVLVGVSIALMVRRIFLEIVRARRGLKAIEHESDSLSPATPREPAKSVVASDEVSVSRSSQ